MVNFKLGAAAVVLERSVQARRTTALAKCRSIMAGQSGEGPERTGRQRQVETQGLEGCGIAGIEILPIPFFQPHGTSNGVREGARMTEAFSN